MTDKVSMDKVYLYRNGVTPRLMCVDGFNSRLPVLTMVPDGTTILHTADGRYYIDDAESGWDLIEVKPAPKTQWRPWKTRDEVPDNIWIAARDAMFQPHEFSKHCNGDVLINGRRASWLFEFASWHTDRRATEGWRKCGVEEVIQ